MTITGEKVIRLALEDLNSSLDQEEMIPSEPSTPLVGPDSVVDSLALVRLYLRGENNRGANRKKFGFS